MFTLEDFNLRVRKKGEIGDGFKVGRCNYACIDAGCRDAGGVEGMAKIDDGTRRFHHRVLLVMFDKLAERAELFSAAHVIFVVLESEI